ncbi:GDP-mannose 4,6-dehydratase [Candidatus Pelagibacter sp.]|nr:GDP-mannose 4,6-dehydratase [Candidatus Pelagibacter sp.]
MKILVTGVAGFIGFNLSKFLLEKKIKIIGLDNINNYYSTKLKKDRLIQLKKFNNFKFYKIDLRDIKKIDKIFTKHKFDAIFHFAAQAGVRYSVDYPRKYIDSNINGFFNILEKVRTKKIKKFFYASSSSVYGDSKSFPLKEKNLLFPTNTYSLSKKFNEDLSSIYNKFYRTNAIGLRFFTVYGEWGRPDMFYSKVLDAAFKKMKLYINNYGNHSRDFTYIRDVNLILYNLLKTKKILGNDILNICSNKPLSIIKLVKTIEGKSKKIRIYKRTMQKADVIKTHGDNTKIKKLKLIKKFTSFDEGIKNTLEWYKKYNSF